MSDRFSSLDLEQYRASDAREPARDDFSWQVVRDGKLRFVSVSQMVAFSPEFEGGCNRRWAFARIFGKKEPEFAVQAAGKDFAKELESYFKTGVDAFSPVLRAAKHFFPHPGPDIEAEQPLGDAEGAIRLRDAYLEPAGIPGTKRMLAVQMLALAGLTASNIPVIGAADFRHRRGEYIDERGVLRREAPGLVVAEIGDLKTTSRIFSHTSRTGKIYPGRAKTVEQVLAHPQMVGYGVHAANRNPDLTHVRLTHVYAQTKHGYAAARRTGLLSVEEVRTRWRKYDALAREMEDVARTATKPEDVPANLNSCFAFYRDCPHAAYCERPARSIEDLLKTRGDQRMPTLFDDVTDVPKNGAPAAPTSAPPKLPLPSGLFTEGQPPAPAAAPPMTDAERAAAIEAGKARLLGQISAGRVPVGSLEGYRAGQGCNGRGFYANANGQGFVPVEAGHVHTAACAVAIPREVGSINPPDSPPDDPTRDMAPLSPEQIAAIEDPELCAHAERHAAACAERAAKEAPAAVKKKSGGKCPSGGSVVKLSPTEIAKRKFDCPGCGKKIDVRDKDFTADFTGATVPGHNVPKEAAPSAPPPLPAAAQSPPPLPARPAAPPPLPTLNVAHEGGVVDVSRGAHFTVGASPAATDPGKGPDPAAFSPLPPTLPGPVYLGPSQPITVTLFGTSKETTSTISREISSEELSRMAAAPEPRSVAIKDEPLVLFIEAGTQSKGWLPARVLFIDAVARRGCSPKSLDAWCEDIVKTLADKYGLLDLRLAPPDSDLGFGRWRGCLAATVRANLPGPGEYALHGVAGSEIRQVVADAFAAECALVVQGSAR